MTGYPRVDVHSTALQLLQILDKRFFGNVGPLESEGDKGRTDFYFLWLSFEIYKTLIVLKGNLPF